MLTLVLPTDRELLLTYISTLALYSGVMQNRAMQNAAAPHSTVAATISHRLFHMAFRSDSRSISR